MSNLWTVRNIGPTVPSVYLDNRVENDNDYGFNMYKPSTEACMEWLNTKETGSVIYVSFGSAASLNADQMVEMGEALKQCTNSFLWVVKPTEQSKLPANFVEETSDKGLIVTWCPQLEVLAHKAVGCFVSHCGWNSTVEAISFGVPVVAMPQFLDQMTNAYFVEQVWGVGIQPKENEQNRTTAKEIERCINEAMNGEKIRKKAIEWKRLAKEAIDENGSSDIYIDEIISRIVAL